MADRQGRPHPGRARPRRRPRDGGRRRVRVRRARGHDRHVPERPDSHRARAAAGGARRRAAVARARRIAEVVRLRVGPAEDRHAAAARSREHRFRRDRSRAGRFTLRARRRSAGAVLVPDAARSSGRRSTAICCTRTIASAISCARTSIARRSSTDRFAASGRATARRSKTRSSGSRTRSGIRSFSSPRASTRARSTSTASR